MSVPTPPSALLSTINSSVEPGLNGLDDPTTLAVLKSSAAPLNRTGYTAPARSQVGTKRASPTSQSRSTDDLELKVAQVLGNKSAGETDPPDIMLDDRFITSVKLDNTGKYLSYGTREGEIFVLEKVPNRWEYRPITHFTGYVNQIDPLHSSEIEAKVKCLCWLPQCNEASFLLSSNEKAIKLWKIYSKQKHIVAGQNCCSFLGAGYDVLATQRLEVPHLIPTELGTVSKLKRQYATEHEYQIHSVSLCSDTHHFLSSDDFMVRLWQLDHREESLVAVNIKPPSEDEFKEIISCAAFNPVHCNLFAYSTSRGLTNICDLRVNTTCDSTASYVAQLVPPCTDSNTDSGIPHVLEPLLSQITDIAYHPNGRLICTRDYLTLKIWDIAMGAQPIKTININDAIKPHMMELYDNDSVFDKFEVSYVNNGNTLITGSYKYDVLSINANTSNITTISRGKKKKSSAGRKVRYNNGKSTPQSDENADAAQQFESADSMKKSLCVSVHPTENAAVVSQGLEATLLIDNDL